MKTLMLVLAIFLLGATIVSPLGCARNDEGDTFADYGFSFRCPAGYEVIDAENSGDEPNALTAGKVIVRKKDGSAEAPKLLLIWRSPSPGSMPETNEQRLAEGFQDVVASFRQVSGDSGKGPIEVGTTIEDTCSGHSMLYAYYEYGRSDSTESHGMLGDTYCDVSSRLFFFITIGPSTGVQSEAVSFLQLFTSTFVCH